MVAGAVGAHVHAHAVVALKPAAVTAQAHHAAAQAVQVHQAKAVTPTLVVPQ